MMIAKVLVFMEACRSWNWYFFHWYGVLFPPGCWWLQQVQKQNSFDRCAPFNLRSSVQSPSSSFSHCSPPPPPPAGSPCMSFGSVTVLPPCQTVELGGLSTAAPGRRCSIQQPSNYGGRTQAGVMMKFSELITFGTFESLIFPQMVTLPTAKAIS